MGVIRRVKQLIVLAVVVLAATYAAVVHQAHHMMDKYGWGKAVDPPATAIVLSAGLEPDLYLSFSSRSRTRMGVWLFRQDKVDQLIMTGGGATRNRPAIAIEMRKLAISLGVPPDKIVAEDRSRTTWENLTFAVPMAMNAGAEQIVVVTDPYHLRRAMLLAEYLGFPEMIPAAAPGFFQMGRSRQILAMSREALAWWYNLGKVAAAEVLGLLGYSDEERFSIIF